MGLYDRDQHLLHRTTLDEVPQIFSVATLATLSIALGGDLLMGATPVNVSVVGAWAVLLLAMISLRAIARWITHVISPAERCLVIGTPADGEYVREQLALTHSVKADLVGTMSAEVWATGGSVLEPAAIDRVILAAQPERRDDLLFIIRRLKAFGMKVSVLPEASRMAGSSVELDHLAGMTLLGMRRFEFTRSSRAIKRTFDIAGSGTALILLAPVMAFVALVVKLESPGPVFFSQTRIGRNGHPFKMLKFRSMVLEAEERKGDVRHLNEGAAGLFKIAADPRITRVGRLLRAYQIDELPQLLNVLVGRMSLVGPRPLIPEEDRMIEGWYRRRLDVPPGITGHWQVLGSSQRIPLSEMVKLDYLYVANWSLWGDVRLVLRTIPFIVGRRGL